MSWLENPGLFLLVHKGLFSPSSEEPRSTVKLDPKILVYPQTSRPLLPSRTNHVDEHVHNNIRLYLS